MKTFVMLTFCSLSMIGCKTALIKSYGIKQPVIENEASLTSFLKEIGVVEVPRIYAYNRMQSYYTAQISGASIPDAKFFNKNGYFVDYKLSPTDCNAQIGPFIENSQSINNLPFDKSIQIKDILGNVVEIHSRNPVKIDENANGYLILYWAKFIGGKLNKAKSLDWLNVYNDARQKGADIQLIFLNMDYQDFWGITNEDIPGYEF
jgi:hypothetical protein